MSFDTLLSRAKFRLYGLYKGRLSIARIEDAFPARPDTAIQSEVLSVNFVSLSDCWLQMEHESFRDYNDWLAENGKSHTL